MAYSKEPQSQEIRALEYLTHALASTSNTMRIGAAVYDVDRDRVVVTVDDQEVTALGPKEWFMSDDELQQMIIASVLSNFGHGR